MLHLHMFTLLGMCTVTTSILCVVKCFLVMFEIFWMKQVVTENVSIKMKTTFLKIVCGKKSNAISGLMSCQSSHAC